MVSDEDVAKLKKLVENIRNGTIDLKNIPTEEQYTASKK